MEKIQLWLFRVSKKSKPVLIQMSLASSSYGQKRRIEASVSYSEVYIAARKAKYNYSQLRYLQINSIYSLY